MLQSWRRRSKAILLAAIVWGQVEGWRLFALDHFDKKKVKNPPKLLIILICLHKKVKNPPKPLPRQQSCFPSSHRNCIHLRQLYLQQILKIFSLTQISASGKNVPALKVSIWKINQKFEETGVEDWGLQRTFCQVLCQMSNALEMWPISVIHQVEIVKWKKYDPLSKADTLMIYCLFYCL